MSRTYTSGWHLDVKSRLDRLGGIAHTHDPVRGDYHVFVTPSVSDDAIQQVLIVAAELSIDLVVCTHYALGSAFVETLSEVWEKALVKNIFGHGDIDTEPKIFHRVEGEMLSTSDSVGSNPSAEGGTKGSHQQGIFSI
jgi:hypothetical protein